MLKALYVRWCRKHGPGGMTFSANAWKVAQETGDTYWRIKIDGWWMVLFSECNHCQSCYQKHFRQEP
jgi:hypothetical protein